MSEQRIRHILSLSGGKDSAALAIHLRDRVPDMEYVFCDTGKELDETYEYLARIGAFLGKPVVTLKDEYGFDHWLKVFGEYLPSPRMRWCTKYLKLFPFERYVGDSTVISYVGIRADEERIGYVSTKPNIRVVYPFKDDGIVYADMVRILEESGIGLPPYLSWRSRSGCYFCFFQQKIEWVGLLKNHENRYWEASRYEKADTVTGRRFTWSQGESLEELACEGRIAQIVADYERRLKQRKVGSGRLKDIFEDDSGPNPCLICTL